MDNSGRIGLDNHTCMSSPESVRPQLDKTNRPRQLDKGSPKRWPFFVLEPATSSLRTMSLQPSLAERHKGTQHGIIKCGGVSLITAVLNSIWFDIEGVLGASLRVHRRPLGEMSRPRRRHSIYLHRFRFGLQNRFDRRLGI